MDIKSRKLKFGAVPSRRPITEKLELRQLLSGVNNGNPPALPSAEILAGNVLTVLGTSSNDTVRVTRSVNGNQSSIVVKVNGSQWSFDDSQVGTILINGSAGNDTISIAQEVTKPARIVGGAGNDSLTGGAGDDTLVGNAGNDTLDGGGGINTADFTDYTSDLNFQQSDITAANGDADHIAASIQRFLSGSGNDTIDTSGFGADGLIYIDSGPGNDSIQYEGIELSADATVHGGDGNDSIFMATPNQVAHYFGDAGNDTFTVERSDGSAHDFNGGDGLDTVDYSGFTGGGWAVKVTFDNLANDGSTSGAVYGSPSLDNVHSDIEKIIGTDGNDTLIGSNNADTLIGSSGQDSIVGNGGDDWIEGDTALGIVNPQHPADTLIGGAGHDTIITQNDNDSVVSDANDTVIDSTPVINGTGGDDLIQLLVKDANTYKLLVNGNESDLLKNELVGLTIAGGDGDDSISIDPAIFLLNGISIIGGDGNDSIIGSNGPDTIDGGDGNDLISGMDGNDQISDGDGNDKVDGGDDNDLLIDGAGDDTLIGGSSSDTIQPGPGHNLFDGGEGIDYLDYSTHSEAIAGGNGTITNASGEVDAYSNFEALTAGSGNDQINIDAAHDSIRSVDGLGGNDLIAYTDLRPTAGDAVPFISGGDGNDSIMINSLRKVIVNTTDGNIDTIAGQLQNDSLIADSNDVLIDTTVTAIPPATPTLTNGVLRVYGTSGDDQILIFRRKSNPNMLQVAFGSQVVAAYKMRFVTSIQIDAGDGDDRIQFDATNGPINITSKIYGGGGDDTIFGGSGNDRIYGGDGNDWISGGAGNDILYGQAGNDRLFGDDGTDYIAGGADTDLIRGGNGRDQIVELIGGSDNLAGNAGDLITKVPGFN